MTSLIILGNINKFTFANSIIAANEKSKELFKTPINKIFIIHSKESQQKLASSRDWLDHIERNDIDIDEIYEKKLEVSSDEKSIRKFVSYLDFILNGLQKNDQLLIDLSNGTTVQKNLLSIVGYILDIQNQFVIDIAKLSKLTDNRGFIENEILKEAYTNVPDSTLLDNIAYLNLSEIFRYKKIINIHTKNFVDVDKENADETFFRDNLIHSIRLKLSGDQTKDNAIYRIAASSIAVSIEELMSQIIQKYIGDPTGKTLGQKIQMLQHKIRDNYPNDFDLSFFNRFNEFMLYLRNTTTHKGKLLTDVEKFKADLSVKMSFPYLEFYSDIIYPLLADKKKHEATKSKRIERLQPKAIAGQSLFYFGLDGDDTGKILEELFVISGDEKKFRMVSNQIELALAKIAQYIKDNDRLKLRKKAIIFQAGDDLLFKGSFSEDELRYMKDIYKKETGGLTCSIGFGESLHEVYLALKLAKSQPGKNSITGIRFTRDKE